jgi:hypothetical protein
VIPENGRDLTLFLIRGVPESTPFKPSTRKEVRDIGWHEVSSLPFLGKPSEQTALLYTKPLKNVLRHIANWARTATGVFATALQRKGRRKNNTEHLEVMEACSSKPPATIAKGLPSSSSHITIVYSAGLETPACIDPNLDASGGVEEPHSRSSAVSESLLPETPTRLLRASLALAEEVTRARGTNTFEKDKVSRKSASPASSPGLSASSDTSLVGCPCIAVVSDCRNCNFPLTRDKRFEVPRQSSTHLATADISPLLNFRFQVVELLRCFD